jgi:hypothetical protein
MRSDTTWMTAPLANVATAEPKNGTLEIAGPELIRMDEFVRRFLMASQFPSYAIRKPLMPTPSASSFLNEPRTRLPGSGLRNTQQSGSR